MANPEVERFRCGVRIGRSERGLISRYSGQILVKFVHTRTTADPAQNYEWISLRPENPHAGRLIQKVRCKHAHMRTHEARYAFTTWKLETAMNVNVTLLTLIRNKFRKDCHATTIGYRRYWGVCAQSQTL